MEGSRERNLKQINELLAILETNRRLNGKINKTLKTFRAAFLEERFDRLLVVVLGKKAGLPQRL